MDVIIFGGILILLVVIGWLVITQTNKYLKKQHDKFMEAFKLKFNDSIINKMKQLYMTKEILDEYYDTHVRYATYETIEIYRKYEKNNIHQKLREQYYEVIGLEDFNVLDNINIELFSTELNQAEIDLNNLKNSIIEQIESRFIRVSK